MKLTLSMLYLTVILLAGCNNEDNNPSVVVTEAKTTQLIHYSVISEYPHDTTAYTEGLLMHEGQLYESTGYTNEYPQTKSIFGILTLKTGKINPVVQLDSSKYFGEGISFLHDKWYQLTYRTKIGFVYAAKNFKQLATFAMPVKEGWGMTTDSVNLIMSEGTNVLTYVDPIKLTTIKQLAVTDASGPVSLLNELEYVHGFIYANIFTTHFIVKIDPATGRVTGKLDLNTLAAEQETGNAGAKEMNGIAYNPARHTFFITGKMWNKVYELSVNP